MKANNLIKIKWFRHAHENRNDWLRFGFMELNTKKQISYQEWDLKDMLKYGFASEILSYPDLRHKSFILIENGSKKQKCLVDSEDSFVLFSDLITCVDTYFCAGYNSDIFKHRKLPSFYKWQSEEDIKWYKDTLLKKINDYQDHFYKIKKFIPIAPNLYVNIPLNFLAKFFYKLDDKLRIALKRPRNYAPVYNIYIKRYSDLLALRQCKLNYDITLNDSLWGWPNHRIKLHHALKKLADKGFKINSILKYGTPSVQDNSIALDLKADQFPIAIGSIEDYEKMLASSKLGVFTCGFHWGWRNILTLALFFGIPVVTDRLLTEVYFDIKEFKIYETEDENWAIIEDLLIGIDPTKWENIKKDNQKVYDQYLRPEVVANYFINQINK